MSEREGPLTGQVAVITGASRGIGRIVALHLAARGAAVAALARPSADLASLAAGTAGAEPGAGRGQVLPLAADVTSAQQVAAAFDAAVASVGTPSLVLACAGTASMLGPAWSADPAQWWEAVAVDLLGTMITVAEAVRRMRPAGRGRIVAVYGSLGERQTANASAFAVAKAGIARLTESLAVELAGSGVRVLAIHPGFVRTPMTEQLAWSQQGREWLPEFGSGVERRWGDGASAAALVEAIAGGAADELTGRVLWAGDDLAALAARCRADPDCRRLRLMPGG